MSYQKQQFVDNETVLMAHHLQHMEDGIAANDSAVTGMNTATSSDQGKALKAKTVANGKVTEWEFGETATIDPTLSHQGQAADAKATGDMIQVSTTQPSEQTVKLWVKPESEEYQVPTYAEHEELADEVTDLKSAIDKVAQISGEKLISTSYADHSVSVNYMATITSAGKTLYKYNLSAGKHYLILNAPVDLVVGAGNIEFTGGNNVNVLYAESGITEYDNANNRQYLYIGIATASGEPSVYEINDITDVGGVAYDRAQSLTVQQKAQALTNIGAASVADIESVDDAVDSIDVKFTSELSLLQDDLQDVATPNIYTDDGVTTGAMIRADGTINTSIPDGAYTTIIPVKSGEKYKFVFSHGATSGGWGTRISGYNGETHVQEIALIECSSSAETKVQDFTIPSGVNGIRVSYYYYSSVTSAVIVRYSDGFADVSAVDTLARTGKYVYPEWFGAVGDGVADDTTALSQAVAYARDNGLILGGVAGKTYLITNTIDLTKTHICFNRATVKAGATLRYMFTVNSYNVDTPITFVIRDMIIDANNTSGGIWYQYALHNRLDNVDFLNVHQTAIANSPAEGSNVAGGGLYIRNCYLEGDASESSQGMFFGTSDDRVQLTILKDFHRGIYNNGTNLFQFVHTWMSKNVENTVCFYHNGGNVAMFGCHFDTYKYAIYRNTDQNLDLIGCLIYINTNLYGAWVDGQWVAGTTPYVIWCTQNCYAYSANVHFTNCSFNPLRTDMELTNTPYQRYQFRDCFFKDNVSGKINDVTVNLTKVTTDTIGDYVNLRQDGRWIKLDALVTPGDEFVAGYTAIMSIPSNYMYPETDDKTAYNAHGHAILYLDAATPSETLTVGVVLNSTSGVISISTPSTLDVSRVKSIEIAMRWPVKKSIAYYKG